MTCFSVSLWGHCCEGYGVYEVSPHPSPEERARDSFSMEARPTGTQTTRIDESGLHRRIHFYHGRRVGGSVSLEGGGRTFFSLEKGMGCSVSLERGMGLRSVPTGGYGVCPHRILIVHVIDPFAHGRLSHVHVAHLAHRAHVMDGCHTPRRQIIIIDDTKIFLAHHSLAPWIQACTHRIGSRILIPYLGTGIPCEMVIFHIGHFNGGTHSWGSISEGRLYVGCGLIDAMLDRLVIYGTTFIAIPC